MKIFMSHSSRIKPLVREVAHHLPRHILSWIDENEILIGDDIKFSIMRSIDAHSDFLLVFVDEHAARSEWVRKELLWAFEHENNIGRPFVLPVVIDRDSWEVLIPEDARGRRYLTCEDYSQAGIRSLAESLVSELFARLSRDLDTARLQKKPNQAVSLIDQADDYLREVADVIRVAVYPHRKENPISIDDLYVHLQTQAAFNIQGVRGFEEILGRLRQQGYLAGVVCYGDDLYVEEEHYAWKTTTNRDQKRSIAAQAVKFVQSNSVIALDAGSTTLEIAKLLGRNLKMRVVDNLRVVTNSIPAASHLLNVASELGIEDNNNRLNIYMAGGRIRCNTLAVVSDEGMTESSGEGDLASTIRRLGGADAAFVGTNGISTQHGFTTHEECECRTKQVLLREARNRFVVTSPEKFDIEERFAFASFDDEINIISVLDGHEDIIRRYEAELERTSSTLIIVR